MSLAVSSLSLSDTYHRGLSVIGINAAKRILGGGWRLTLSPGQIFIQQRSNSLPYLFDVRRARHFLFLEFFFELSDGIAFTPLIEHCLRHVGLIIVSGVAAHSESLRFDE